jgi:hypothetical protein
VVEREVAEGALEARRAEDVVPQERPTGHARDDAAEGMVIARDASPANAGTCTAGGCPGASSSRAAGIRIAVPTRGAWSSTGARDADLGPRPLRPSRQSAGTGAG